MRKGDNRRGFRRGILFQSICYDMRCGGNTAVCPPSNKRFCKGLQADKNQQKAAVGISCSNHTVYSGA